jgi:hypothetical protein
MSSLIFSRVRYLLERLLKSVCQSVALCSLFIFFNSYSGGGVKMGPLGTAATNRRIVPAPVDYDDGEIGRMMIGRGNRSTRRKPAPVPLCPPQIPYALSGREPGSPRWGASD